MKHPRWLVAGTVAAALCLTGCEVSGTMEFGPDSVTYDLTIESTNRGSCPSADLGGVTETVLDDGRIRCQFALTEPYDPNQGRYFWNLSGTTDELITLFVPAAYFNQPDDKLTSVDLTLIFPGPVQFASQGAAPLGNTVHFSDPEALRAGGLLAVGARRPGPPPWALPLAGAVASLLLGVGAGWWLRGRRRPAPAPGPTGDQTTPATPREPVSREPVPRETAPEPDDPSVWAPED